MAPLRALTDGDRPHQQTIGQARVLREVARQGLLPYPTFFASTRPFGTPLGPVALKYVLTVLVICVLPARDAFNFLLDLASYPHLVHIFFSNTSG
jgi:amino acid transporter